MTKRERINEIKQEIEGYGIKKLIANAMLELGNMGFEFSGHGCGMGGEDFGLIKDERYYVNFCDQGRKVQVTVYDETLEEAEDTVPLFQGTVKGAMKFLSKLAA